MMTRRVEEVPTVRWVDIEENTRNNDGLFFQQFLKESLASQGGYSTNEEHFAKVRHTRPLLSGAGSFSRLSQM